MVSEVSAVNWKEIAIVMRVAFVQKGLEALIVHFHWPHLVVEEHDAE